MSRETLTDIVMGILIVGIGGAGVFLALDLVEDQRATAECVKWESWAEKYPKFYLTEWQEKQCRAMGIDIDAPVRK